MDDYAELQNQLVSILRICEYTELRAEDATTKARDSDLLGSIDFLGVTMGYREGTDPALRNVYFKILPGEKVGIVGRSGAGKSSILQALYRLCDVRAGKVLVEGVDVRSLGVHTLRRHIAYIPQHPSLFAGTLRSNLDPAGEFSDPELYNVLSEVHLLESVNALPAKLDTQFSEGGSLFSAG